MGIDGNCGYRAVADFLGKGEEYHPLIRRTLISELTLHRDIYGRRYENQANIDKIYVFLVPSITGLAPVSKWMSFPEMGHLIASAYDRVCADLTRFGFSEKFFTLHIRPPLDVSGRIICIGLSYFGYILRGDDTSYKRGGQLEDPFIERMVKFEEMM
ncbi:uncharacterized protein LOC131642400 [Vicia villosa]|uniref:uncharacterized protein LOC131642400 n=1 Tax=Vicia villosa TaxID=3911 RepID=UPI00273C391F|nr:uncharacterized protein LOC131642400 [Vicia villosa]